MPQRCGDLARFKYKVTSELVDKFVTLLICRKKQFVISAIFTERLKKEETRKVNWPDQEVEGQRDMFYGGRKVDYKGLDKLSYKDKFDHQEFEIDLYQGSHKKRSAKAPLKIEPYADVTQEPKQIGIPMETGFWEYDSPPVTDVKTGGIDYSAATFTPSVNHGNLAKDYWEKYPSTNTGKFSLEIKDGVFILTVKICLQTSAPVQPGEGLGMIFYYIKHRVEEFWNSEACGFNQWFYHRRGCKREGKCNCSILKNQKREYINAGCCKFPFKLKVEKGGASDNVINIHYLNPLQRKAAIRNRAGLSYWGAADAGPLVDAHGKKVAVCTTELFFPENRANTYAHEIGHMLGFPDQYPTGVVAKGAMSAAGPVKGSVWPIDDSSVMGMNQSTAKQIHAGASWFDEWINSSLNEAVDLTERLKK